MSCDNHCRQASTFPKPVFNRPGLSTIAYRIGSYADLREHMLALLDADPRLAAWTHRLPDDPGIALIEAAAEVGDVLSFYQDLYANEAYLRSAKWRDSVADLVRLLGYRLAPGLAGRARFAFAVKGERPVRLPAGLGLKAQLEGDDQPSVFETSAELIAQPALSQFHLYRPRRVPPIQYGTDTFTLVLDAGANVALKAGDRLLVGLARDSHGTCDHTQLLVIDKIWESFGSTVVKMKGGITCLKPAPRLRHLPQLFSPAVAASVATRSIEAGGMTTSLTGSMVPEFTGSTLFSTLASGLGLATLGSTPRLQAWKLGNTHRHFGHNAPSQQVDVDAKGRASTRAVSYQRRLDTSTTGIVTPALSATQMPLDGEAASVVAGMRLLIEAKLGVSDSGQGRKRLLERRVAQVDRQSLGWGPLTGASTVASLDQPLAITEDGKTLGHADIRGMSFHEVVGEPFALQADFAPTAASRGAELYFYGQATDAAALAGRSLLFVGPDQALISANALPAAATDPADTGTDASRPGFHRVRLDREFDYAQFGHDSPSFTVYGNLVPATQGKTEAPVTLGDGDGRALFQTFALPKTPNSALSYLLDTTQLPPQLAQLQVWVDGVLWTRVDSLFGHGPQEHVYIVREDADGKSWVQFGDGKTGARLRSGRGNVIASYRTGNGAHGPLKPGAKPQLEQKVTGLEAAFLLEPVTGGAQPEAAAGARVAAPGTMQSLGRIVSLADYEAEALAIPGVIKARAAWVSVDGAPLVRVTLLTDSRAAADASAAADALRAAVRARGAGRCPLLLVPGARTQVSLQLMVGHDPRLHADELRRAILEALGATGLEGNGVDSTRGLFSWQQRQFGEGVHGSQVVGAVQNLPGVTWVRLGALAASGPQLLLPRSHALATQRSLACAGDHLLALQSDALQLQLAADKEGLPS